jgi:hypothetical protein
VKSELVKSTHLARKAVVYIRQSTPHQIVSNEERLRLQYALRQRAREFGWHEADIDVIDADLGLSGASAAQRSGFTGAFVYGGTRMRKIVREGVSSAKVPRPMEEWRIVVKDRYPAYINWPTYEKIRGIIRDNRAE